MPLRCTDATDVPTSDCLWTAAPFDRCLVRNFAIDPWCCLSLCCYQCTIKCACCHHVSKLSFSLHSAEAENSALYNHWRRSRRHAALDWLGRGSRVHQQ